MVNTKIAFTLAATVIVSRAHQRSSPGSLLDDIPVKGHRPRRRFVVTLLRVGACAVSFCEIKEKAMRRAPVRRKRKSDKINVIRILSTMLSSCNKNRQC